ncbi:hypothetical protein [Pseudomonas sp. RIT-PI-S]|uniref:hypothetical protein n=1 Tax=Pseudomonas sp. RIT-PI-S TaxID=3035295 RepID=UPI0021D7FE1D|nr:hypothetical protein [Pseudomonas sp. RIT-PI-S]
MNKQALTRRALFTLGLVMVTGRALASGGEGHEGPAPRPHHRGYKVGGGIMVALVMVAVLGSMALFGELRRNRLSKMAAPPPPRPAPLPEGPEWETSEHAASSPDTHVTHGPRYRRGRRDVPAPVQADHPLEP